MEEMTVLLFILGTETSSVSTGMGTAQMLEWSLDKVYLLHSLNTQDKWCNCFP